MPTFAGWGILPFKNQIKMKNIRYALLFGAVLCCCACGDTPPTAEDFARQQMETPPAPPSSVLIHNVYFNLKDDISEEDKAQFLAELESLAGVSHADYVEAGSPADSKDPRMDKDFDMALQVGFTGLEALAAYQADSLHLAVKKNVGGMLAAPPVVFDFWTDK